MTSHSHITVLPSIGLSLRSLEALLRSTKYQGFPVVENRTSKILLGYIGRTELRYAIDRTKKESTVSPQAKCLFTAPPSVAVRTPSAATPAVTFDDIASSSVTQTIDFSRFVSPTPLTVHPKLPLETVMEIFKKMGPRVILVEFKGRLAGLITVKDCLKYQFKVEALERGGTGDTDTNNHDPAEVWEIWLWNILQRVSSWCVNCVGKVTGGRINLGDGEARGESLLAGQPADPRDEREPIRLDTPQDLDRTHSERIAEGTSGMELQDRRWWCLGCSGRLDWNGEGRGSKGRYHAIIGRSNWSIYYYPMYEMGRRTVIGRRFIIIMLIRLWKTELELLSMLSCLKSPL